MLMVTLSGALRETPALIVVYLKHDLFTHLQAIEDAGARYKTSLCPSWVWSLSWSICLSTASTVAATVLRAGSLTLIFSGPSHARPR